MISYDIIVSIVTIILGAVIFYLRTKTNIINKAGDYITEAEKAYIDVNKSGSLKMDYCIEKLYSIVPIVLKTVFSKEVIQIIVQGVFDTMKQYVEIGLSKIINTK